MKQKFIRCVAMCAWFSIQLLSAQDALFTRFVYEGHDDVYARNPLSRDEFYSPILQGCYPDPSITRKGNDYYLVCSSFAMTPGVPLFHSTDLVNWEQVGHVLMRPSQLDVRNAGISMGVYAPTIRYNPHNDMFYLITTQFSGGFGNFAVKTKNPAEGWSDAIRLDFGGIDPSFFFDDDGKAYIVHNDACDTPRYDGHRVIRIWEYDLVHDRVVAGSDKIIVDGGVKPEENPIWIEGPHLYKKDGKYYLLCAEGGTGDNHSEVLFVADAPMGEYRPAPVNPVLSQRHLPTDRADKVTCAGHADLIETPDGKYFGVFLAMRPNETGRVNTGRETFLLPVDWSGEYPVFQGGMEPLPPKQKLPDGVKNKAGLDGFVPNGNFTFADDFSAPELDARWVSVRGAREAFASTGRKGLQITPLAADIKEVCPVSALYFRQQHRSFTATATLRYAPLSEQHLAGLVCYQSERYYYLFGITRKDGADWLVLQRTEAGQPTLLFSTPIDTGKPVRLQVEARGDAYTFRYAEGRRGFRAAATVSGDILSTDVAGGFTGALIGLYATSAGRAVFPE